MSPAPSVSVGANSLDRDLATPSLVHVEDGSSAARDCHPANSLLRQKLHRVAMVAAARRPVILGADRDVDQRQQFVHAVFPASAVEHNRKAARASGLRGRNAHRHVMSVNLHNGYTCQPPCIELRADGRERAALAETTVRSPSRAKSGSRKPAARHFCSARRREARPKPAPVRRVWRSQEDVVQLQ